MSQSMHEKITNMICCEIVSDGGQAIVSSLDVALHFGKSHKNVLQSIDNLGAPDEFSRLNFQPRNYIDERGKEYRMFNITRDGFTLLAMGFTGKRAMEWKIAYIEAFNRMESELRGRYGRGQMDLPMEQPRRNISGKHGRVDPTTGFARKMIADAVIEFEGKPIRVYRRDDGIRLNAPDCCYAMGYVRPNEPLFFLSAKHKRIEQVHDTMGRRRKTNTITIEGALEIAERSVLATAPRFHTFMRSEVSTLARLEVH